MSIKRDSNMDYLRCVLIIMVVAVHYINAGMGGAISFVREGSANMYFVHFVESMSIICVDGFVILAGYYGLNRKKTSFRKPIGLVLTVIGYNYLFFFLSTAIGVEKFSLNQLILNILPQNWYVTLFIVILIFAPYLNLLIQNLSQKQFLILIILGVGFFSVWQNIVDIVILPNTNTVGGISAISVHGGADGYSIVNFVLLYFIGAYLKKYPVKISKRMSLIGYAVMTVLVTIGSLFSDKFWNYDNVLVIAETIFLILFFEKLKLKGGIVSTAAESTLGVFIIHTKYLICISAWSLFDIPKYSRAILPLFVINMILVVLSTFLLCTLIDFCLRFALRPLSNRLNKIIVLNKNYINLQ